jgi:ketosteroid isomerase-like protein
MPVGRRTLLKSLSFFGFSRLLNAQAANSTATTVLPANLEAAIQRTRDASVKFGNGDPAGMKMVYSHAEDALIMGALGGYEQGGDAVAERLEWAAKHFRDTRNQSFERLAAGSSGELGYEVFLEKSESRVGDTDTFSPTVLRVTHLFRRESGQWKLIQRQADPLKPRS